MFGLGSGLWAALGVFVVLSPVAVLRIRGVLRSAAASEVIGARGAEFRCGVRSKDPPFYATFPRAKLVVADELLAVRVFTLGDFAVRREELRSVELGSSAMLPILTIRSSRLNLVVSVSTKDLPSVLEALESRHWAVVRAAPRHGPEVS